jgi:DNA-binding LytR/AlgR family response regulator
MNLVKCLIVDDEPIAAQVIENYLDKLDKFEVSNICNNAIEAFEYLQSNNVDLVFLDIQMPKITGFEFLKALHQPPKIIIITAFREFAFEGFELDVVDYLLKPVPFDRFLKAIDKFNNIVAENSRSTSSAGLKSTLTGEIIWVRADRKNVRLRIEDISYIEGLKDYVKIYEKGNMIISKIPLKKIEQKLPSERFIRIHRSYLVSVSKITAYNNEGIELGPIMLPIGKIYKESVLSFLRNHN